MSSPRPSHFIIDAFWFINTALIIAVFTSFITFLLPHSPVIPNNLGKGYTSDIYIETPDPNKFNKDLIKDIESLNTVKAASAIYSPTDQSISITTRDKQIKLFSPDPRTVMSVSKIDAFNPLPGHINLYNYIKEKTTDPNELTLASKNSERIFTFHKYDAIEPGEYYIHLDDLNQLTDDIYISRIAVRLNSNVSAIDLEQTISKLKQMTGEAVFAKEYQKEVDDLLFSYNIVGVFYLLLSPLLTLPITWVLVRVKMFTAIYQSIQQLAHHAQRSRRRMRWQIVVDALSLPLVSVTTGLAIGAFVGIKVYQYIWQTSSYPYFMFPWFELGVVLLAAVAILWCFAMVRAVHLMRPAIAASSPESQLDQQGLRASAPQP